MRTGAAGQEYSKHRRGKDNNGPWRDSIGKAAWHVSFLVFVLLFFLRFPAGNGIAVVYLLGFLEMGGPIYQL